MTISSEFGLIAKLTSGTPVEGPALIRGVGDDCAVIDGGPDRDWIITVDALVENVHFDLRWPELTMKKLGARSLAINLSDIAAMGAKPRFYLVTIGIPSAHDDRSIKEFYDGMEELGSKYGAILIGGDTVFHPNGLSISITAIGEAPRDRLLYRSGAKAGDLVYVTGTFGSAALGVNLLQRGISGTEFVRRLISPVPQLEAGEAIAKSGLATAMIDVSDGLLADLGHIADMSGVGFEIDVDSVPYDEGFDKVCRDLGFNPMELSLSGGDDYELLFTIEQDKADKFEELMSNSAAKVSRIGKIVLDPKRRAALKEGNEIRVAGGWDHFRDKWEPK